MSVDTDLRARLGSLRIKIEWTEDEAQDRPSRLVTISSFSKRLLDYGAFLISSSAHTEPENESAQTTGGGYCLYYRLSPNSSLFRALCGEAPRPEPQSEIELALLEERG